MKRMFETPVILLNSVVVCVGGWGGVLQGGTMRRIGSGDNQVVSVCSGFVIS